MHRAAQLRWVLPARSPVSLSLGFALTIAAAGCTPTSNAESSAAAQEAPRVESPTAPLEAALAAHREQMQRESQPSDAAGLGGTRLDRMGAKDTRWAAEALGRMPTLPTRDALPSVERWLPNEERCERRGRRRFCNGPRRVPAPFGPAARQAETLELGTHRCAAELIRTAPRPEWLKEVERLGIEPPDELVWPIDEGFFGRGVGFTREDDRSLRHRGVDLMAPHGAEIRALADALVAYADNSVSGYGNMLVLLHGGGAVSMYAHLESIAVFPGQVVRAGQKVARLGTTGLSRGPHLHLEWREGGQAADLMDRFPDWRLQRRPLAD